MKLTTELLIEKTKEVENEYPCPEGMDSKSYREGIYFAIITQFKDENTLSKTDKMSDNKERLFNASEIGEQTGHSRTWFRHGKKDHPELRARLKMFGEMIIAEFSKKKK